MLGYALGMWRKLCVLVGSGILGLFAASAPAAADDDVFSSDVLKKSEWRFVVAPYVWMAAVSGKRSASRGRMNSMMRAW